MGHYLIRHEDFLYSEVIIDAVSPEDAVKRMQREKGLNPLSAGPGDLAEGVEIYEIAQDEYGEPVVYREDDLQL